MTLDFDGLYKKSSGPKSKTSQKAYFWMSKTIKSDKMHFSRVPGSKNQQTVTKQAKNVKKPIKT